jgi:hypothetical protein
VFLEVIGREGKVERGGMQVLRTRVRPQWGEKGDRISTFGIDWEGLMKRAIVHRPIALPQRGMQGKPSIAVATQRRDAAAGDYQFGSAAKGPNRSIVGAAAFSSGADL